jgi:hypothetical protein
MSLTEKDLKSIKGLIDQSIESNNHKLIDQVKDIVDFSIDKSEQKSSIRFDKLENEIAAFRAEMHRKISDIAEMNREFLGTMNNHEQRITKLELTTNPSNN